MALPDQPYLPFYVDDWMNNTKLKMCSAGAHGLMISIMCLMHKSETYGVILLKQKFEQSAEQKDNFALQIAKTTSFDSSEVNSYLSELLEESILHIDGEMLICKRMFKDGEISLKRSFAGKNGGEKTQSNIKNKVDFAKAKSKAKPQANSVIGIETGVENVNEIKIEFPFKSDVFKIQWNLWKDYKKVEHNFKYKSEASERAGLNQLKTLSGGNEEKAIQIMAQSVQNGWKGFFPLKQNQNGTQTHPSQRTDAEHRESAVNAVNQMLGIK